MFNANLSLLMGSILLNAEEIMTIALEQQGIAIFISSTFIRIYKC